MLLDDAIADLLLKDSEARAAYLKQRWLCQMLDVLVEARLQAGLTQAQVAERMGTTQSSVARLERDLDGGISLRRFAAYLIACGRMPATVTVHPFEEAR